MAKTITIEYWISSYYPTIKRQKGPAGEEGSWPDYLWSREVIPNTNLRLLLHPPPPAPIQPSREQGSSTSTHPEHRT